MFMLHMPWSFRVGSRAEVRINSQPAVVWWRDRDHLVINETDVRPININQPTADNLQVFYCGDADGTQYEKAYEDEAGGFIVRPKAG